MRVNNLSYICNSSTSSSFCVCTWCDLKIISSTYLSAHFLIIMICLNATTTPIFSVLKRLRKKGTEVYRIYVTYTILVEPFRINVKIKGIKFYLINTQTKYFA